MVKVLKIKRGSIYDKATGKTQDVFEEAWEKTSKDGNRYFEIRTPIFVNEVINKDKKPESKSIL